jgi:hypothetical protein
VRPVMAQRLLQTPPCRGDVIGSRHGRTNWRLI